MNPLTKFKNSDNYTKYSVITIIFFSIIVLFLASIYHVSGDGCWHISSAKFISNNLKIPFHEPLGRDEPFWSPPLYHFTVAFIYFNFNSFSHTAANFAIKFVSPIFGILALIFSFLVIKKLSNSKIAFYSIIFLSFFPIIIDYSVLSYVESMLLFFVVLSVYFMINKKPVLSAISAGLAILTKYNGVFILPVLVYLVYRNFEKKESCKKSTVVIFISLLVASPWLIRNWILLGNPVWPFLNFIFKGIELKSYSTANLHNLISLGLFIATYLGFFGVPDGNYNLLSSLNVPYINIFLAIWIIGTIIFVIPLIIGFFKKKNHSKLLAIWIISYFILFLLYVANVGFSVSRIILPAFPAIAVIWAFGLESLIKNKRKLIAVILTLIMIGFVFASFAKFSYASKSWDFYEQDFEWARSNTPLNSVFVAEGQCVPFNLERTSLYATSESLNKADYIWVNQNFNLDARSILSKEKINQIQSRNYKIEYENKKTGTIIYKTK